MPPKKNLHSYFTFLVLIISIFLFFNNCSENKPNEPEIPVILSDKITVGSSTEELTKDISPAGGSIIIDNAESILNGMEIVVPEEGYNETRTYIIKSSPITDHKLGEYFNPVSPMITIENGGGYSEMPIQIKIPIQKNEEEFSMGFLFNETTGELEALPVIELTDSYIIVETRHFALSQIKSNYSLGKTSIIAPIANVIISSIDESILSQQSVLNSGFTPGIDDWEFINFGSYISPGGHCAGQSISAMWYYSEKKLKGEPGLFHRFDSVCKIENPIFMWQDNPHGYRLASSVQEDADFSGILSTIQHKIPDHNVWKVFIYAFLITERPQYVGVYNTIAGGGHAIIAYKINIPEGKIYVADPNYPNNRTLSGASSIRVINFENNKFLPYPSFDNAREPGKDFDKIRFFATTTRVDWTKVGERYEQFEKEINGYDWFVEYDLFVKLENEDILFEDGMEVTENVLKLYCKNDKIPLYLPGTDRLQKIDIYDTNGYLIAQANDEGIANIQLSSGVNEFGIYIMGYTDQEYPHRYYDFQWVQVNAKGQPGLNYTECTFELTFNGNYSFVDEDSSYSKAKCGSVESEVLTGSFTGNTFNGSYNKDKDLPHNENITITLSADHKRIINLAWNVPLRTYIDIYGDPSDTMNETAQLTAQSIPYDSAQTERSWYFDRVYWLYGSETCNSIVSLSQELEYTWRTRTLIDYSCAEDDNCYPLISGGDSPFHIRVKFR